MRQQVNRRLLVAFLSGTFLFAPFFSGAAVAEEAAKSEYTIPAELKPVRTWKTAIPPKRPSTSAGHTFPIRG
jgi:hypothetical protein